MLLGRDHLKMTLTPYAFGRTSEEKGREYLAQMGYQIVAANVRVGRFEIDLIAKDGPILIFIEIKARRSCPENIWDAVSQKKKFFIRAAAQRLLDYYKGEEFRFDVLFWNQDRWVHIPDAF